MNTGNATFETTAPERHIHPHFFGHGIGRNLEPFKENYFLSETKYLDPSGRDFAGKCGLY